LGGRSVIPGCIDSNGDNSFVGGDIYKQTMVNGKLVSRGAVDNGKVVGKSREEMLGKIKTLVAEARPGTPVFVRLQEQASKMFMSSITVKELDAIAPGNPLVLNMTSSEGLANTAMLEKAFASGLRRDYFGIIRDKAGRPTGQVFGQALGFITLNLRDWPELTEQEYREQDEIINTRLKAGVTTLTGHGTAYTFTLFNQFYHQGRLKIRIRPDLDLARQNPLADQFLRRVPNLVNFGLGDGLIRIAGAAIGPVDGGSDVGDIMTNEPKQKEHPLVGGGRFGRSKWTGTEWTGKQWADLTDQERVETDWSSILLLRKYGWNIGGIHNMGSGATTLILKALIEADKQPDIRIEKMLARDSLDHNLIWDAQSIALAKQLGDTIAFGLAPEIFGQDSLPGAPHNALFYQYGESMHVMQPVKDLLKAGVNIHLEGSADDLPPLYRIARFVTRTEKIPGDASGKPGRVWGKAQAVDRRDALRMLTINAARFISEEALLGSIEPGKYADMVVLSGDYLAVPEDKIETLSVVTTIVAGNVVYDASEVRPAAGDGPDR
jgi:predicted amidohydrolase YtcJ